MKAHHPGLRQSVPRSMLRVDSSLLRWLRTSAFTIILGFVASLTLPFSVKTPEFGVDHSYAFGSNYFPNMGYRYGLDVVFTYGPLGYVESPEPSANNLATANLIRLAIWLIFLVHLTRLYRLGARGAFQAFVLMAVMIAAHKQLILFNFDYFILATLVVVVIYLIERPEGWAGYICMIFIVGLLSLVKFSAYLLSIMTILLLIATRMGWPPKLPGWKDRFVPLAILLAAPVAFMTCHVASLAAFWAYAKGSLELSSGYSAAMSSPTLTQDLFYTVILLGLFSTGLVYAVTKRTLPWTTAGALALLYWVNWKHGFVRGDVHVMLSYSFGMVLAGSLICLLRGRREMIQYSVVLPCFAFVAFLGINSYWPVWTEGYWASGYQRHMTQEVMELEKSRARAESELNANDPLRRLPSNFQGLLDGSTTTVFPWELAYAETGRFRLSPLYVMQAYSAYTEYLDGMTAERIRKRAGQGDQILFEWESIDERHPLLDVPATWRAMFDYYEPMLVGDDRLLLAPRKAPLQHRVTPLRRVALPFGTWVDLPATTSVLWTKIHIPFSVRGQCVNFLYKTPAMWLTADRDSGTRARFRVIPSVLNTLFPITHLPLDFRSLATLWQTQQANTRVTRIRLDTEAPDDYREPSMELSEEAHAQVAFVQPIRETLDSLRKSYHFAALSDIPNSALGTIDTINGRSIQPFPDEQHRLAVRSGQSIEIGGWAASARNGVSLDAIYGVVNDRLVRAGVTARPDVATFYKNPALQQCGFQLTLSAADLGKGPQSVVVFGVNKKTKVCYRILIPVSLSVY